MRNVSFDNWWLLLIAVPLAAVVVAPYLWAIRKENKTKATVTSLVLHIVIVCIIALALAGTTLTTYMTKTEVIYVADVSYSTNKNLELIDSYIAKVSKTHPRNTKASLVCFGKDYELLADFGEKFPSVTTAQVDDSATDISAALSYAGKLFSNDTIKHIVLITDGNETDPNAANNLVRVVEELYANSVYLDVMYIDSNMQEGQKEVQLTGVDASDATYLNHEASVSVLLQCSADNIETRISLYKDGEYFAATTKNLAQGFHTETFTLDTSAVGSHDYEVKIETVNEADDLSQYNNSCSFTQSVTGTLNVLLITTNQNDVEALQGLYGEDVHIDSYVNDPYVPFTVESLCAYDEIVISETDVTTLENTDAFIDSLDKVVSVFGKSLINLGDGKLQNGVENKSMQAYGDLLPVKYGNSEQDSKLYAIVLDSSRSMNYNFKMKYAKMVAENLLNILNDDDRVLIMGFSGEPRVIHLVANASERYKLIQAIEQVTVTQGTVMGAALARTFDMIKGMDIENMQVMLISDGLSYSMEENNPVDVAQQMYEAGITVSTVCISSTEGAALMKNVAAAGHGNYFSVSNDAEAGNVVYDQIAPELGALVIEGESKVSVKNAYDPVVKGLENIPAVYGFIQSKAKNNATVILQVPYQKPGGFVVDVPLYAYWNYGNGKVSCFTSDLLGAWTENWNGNEGHKFLSNVFTTNIPQERVDYPYTLNVEFDGVQSLVEVIPVTINPYATLQMDVTLPDGTVDSQTLYFDQTRYYYEFSTPLLGKYQVKITYSYGNNTYVNTAVFHIDRSPEYDSFVLYSAATLTSAVRDRGTVYEDDSLKVENNMDEVSTYTVDFTIPLLAMAVALYVIDIIIRKLTWADIRTLFKKTASTSADLKKGG